MPVEPGRSRGYAGKWASGPDGGHAAGLIYVGDCILRAGDQIGAELDGLRDEIRNLRTDAEARAEAIENVLLDIKREIGAVGS